MIDRTAVLEAVDDSAASSRNWTKILTWVFVFCIVLGVSLLGYSWWATYGQEAGNRAAQDQLERVWDQHSIGESLGAAVGNPVKPPKPGPPPLGAAVARIWAPSLGQHWMVVEGVNEWDIKSAPGHYPGTAMPAQRGNFAVAGHRSPGIFWDLDRLKSGDNLIVETKNGYHIYRVTGIKITDPQSWPEVSPNPPGFKAGSRVLTLTTCNPKTGNSQRLVVHALFERTQATWRA